MTTQQLFISLLYRLGDFAEAVILYHALSKGADKREYKTTERQLANELGNEIDRFRVRRALNRMSTATGALIEVRTLPNYRTCIKVNRDAVDALLREPINPNLPGMSTGSFPYIEHLAAAA